MASTPIIRAASVFGRRTHLVQISSRTCDLHESSTLCTFRQHHASESTLFLRRTSSISFPSIARATIMAQINDNISCSWTRQQDRGVSSKRPSIRPIKRTLQKSTSPGGAGPLANEHLIAALLDGGRGRPKRSAGSVEVRLVLDQKDHVKSSVQVISLMEAIELSTEESLDLVGISLKQSPPVIKATDFGKLMFEKKKSNAAASSKRHSEVKSLKEFQFKAGVAANDLDRKVGLMMEYLIKGHNCRVTISSNWKNLNRDHNALKTTLERVRTLVGDIATEARGFVVNERGNRATLLLSPNAQSVTVKQKRKEL